MSLPLTPRRVAGLLATPGCERRARLVAGGADLDQLAARLGAPDVGQSPFALARSAQFAARLAADGHAAVRELIHRRLGTRVGATVDSDLAGCLADPDVNLHLIAELTLDAPGTSGAVLAVPGTTMIVSGPRLHLVDARSYAMIDGQADPVKVAATSRELAVVVAALRTRTDRISARTLLVLPQNFGLTPTGAALDVTPQLARVTHLRLPVPAAPELLPELDRRFGDGCAQCPLLAHCGAEEAALRHVARLGDTLANLCGARTTVEEALAAPPPDQAARLRLRAAASGRAEPRATVRHTHLAARPLVITGYHLAGEPAAVVALRYGTAPDEEKLLVVADPRDRDERHAALREFAADLTSYMEGFSAVEPVVRKDFTVVECATHAPQLVTPNSATAEWLTELLGRYLRGADTPESITGGLHLGWFAGRRVLPGAAAVITATGLLGTHWATGQLAAEDGHLASLLAWIDPGRPAALIDGRQPPAGPVSDPRWDAEALTPALGHLPSVHAAADAELRPAWADTWHALDLVRGRFPQVAKHVADRWERDRWSYTAHRDRVAAGTASFAARLHGVPAYRFLHELETRTAALERQMALDDPLVMSAYVVSGEALTGTVTKVDREHVITTPQGRELLRPRIWLATAAQFARPIGTELWLAADPRIMATVEAVEPRGVELIVCKGAVQRAALSRLPETGAEIVLAPFGAEDVFPSRLPERLPWQFGHDEDPDER